MITSEYLNLLLNDEEKKFNISLRSFFLEKMARITIDEKINFPYFSFYDCCFDEVKFTGNYFNQCIFENCLFENIVFAPCTFNNCIFIGCAFKNCDFNCHLENCIFEKGEIINSAFSGTLDRCKMNNTTLSNNQILYINAGFSIFKDIILDNCIFKEEIYTNITIAEIKEDITYKVKKIHKKYLDGTYEYETN